MTVVIPNEGKAWWLNAALQNPAAFGSSLAVKLFVNDFTPDDTTTIDDFTEASTPGYAEVGITAANWGAATVVGNQAQSDYATSPVFTMTGDADETAYGFYLQEVDDAFVVAAGRFDDPTPLVSGAVVTLDPFRAVLPLV